jgi:hypothetical protein
MIVTQFLASSLVLFLTLVTRFLRQRSHHVHDDRSKELVFRRPRRVRHNISENRSDDVERRIIAGSNIDCFVDNVGVGHFDVRRFCVDLFGGRQVDGFFVDAYGAWFQKSLSLKYQIKIFMLN